MPLSDFFSGPRETACQKEELLTFISVPLPPPNTGVSFEKFSRREANALSVASVASRLTLEDRKIRTAVTVLGAVAPIPMIASKVSRFVVGKRPSENIFQKGASIAKEEAKPISDIRGSAWYRRELIQILTYRTLKEAFRKAQTNT